MRKVILALGISLDGYIARPDDAIDFLTMPQDFWKAVMAPFSKSVDAAIMGRKTYDVGLKVGGFNRGPRMDYYVFSRTLPEGERNGCMITHKSPAEIVAGLRAEPGKKKDIWAMGGGDLARQLLTEDLVDEIHLGVVPVLIGAGIPIFPAGFPQREFELMECKSFSHDLVSMKYRRVREDGGPKSKAKAKAKARRKTKSRRKAAGNSNATRK
jgi:dihydrofolate reductase